MKAFLVSLLILSATRFADAATCESLTGLKLQDTTITMAESVAPGGFVPAGPRGGRGGAGPQINPYSNLPAFCRIAATLKPSSDSDIKIEVWLPASGWNMKFEAVGNGGWSGSITYGALADGLRRGYATASTDTGHEGGSGSFALGHPEKLIDFGQLYSSVQILLHTHGGDELLRCAGWREGQRHRKSKEVQIRSERPLMQG
jgi:feruloyl esterase